MIDTLDRFLPIARARNAPGKLSLVSRGYALVTVHRPSNVDRHHNLQTLARHLELVQERLPVIFPVHPRTRARLQDAGLFNQLKTLPRLRVLEPMGYLDFLSLMDAARIVVTDSGGIQEETTVLGVPCLTLRDNTERPITIEHGTNRLVGATGERLIQALDEALSQSYPLARRPALWDGHATERIMHVIAS